MFGEISEKKSPRAQAGYMSLVTGWDWIINNMDQPYLHTYILIKYWMLHHFCTLFNCNCNCHAGVSLITGILFLIGGILVVVLFRGFVHNLIMAEIPLLPDSQVTKAWIDPPVRPLMRLYFFNTTNPAEFLRGEKPILSEVGPYVYEERWSKEQVKWSQDKENVKYKLKKIFIFRQDLSEPLSENDKVTTPNVPLFVSSNINSKIYILY